MQRRSSLNKHRPLPGITSPTEDDKPASNEPTKSDAADGDKRLATDVTATSENSAPAVAESKPQAAAGPATNPYKLKELPLEEVIAEVETRCNRLKTFNKFSTSDCTDDLRYLNAATRCGSNPEVNHRDTVS